MPRTQNGQSPNIMTHFFMSNVQCLFFAKDVSPVAFIDRLDYEKKNSHRTDIHFSNKVEKIFIENIYTLLNVGLALMT